MREAEEEERMVTAGFTYVRTAKYRAAEHVCGETHIPEEEYFPAEWVVHG
jgi:hypothetical protein